MFGGLGLQGNPGGSSDRNNFEDSVAELGTGSGKDIFEGGFKFAAFDARNNFNRTASSVHRKEERFESPYTQEHQKLEGKLKHRVN